MAQYSFTMPQWVSCVTIDDGCIILLTDYHHIFQKKRQSIVSAAQLMVALWWWAAMGENAQEIQEEVAMPCVCEEVIITWFNYNPSMDK